MVDVADLCLDAVRDGNRFGLWRDARGKERASPADAPAEERGACDEARADDPRAALDASCHHAQGGGHDAALRDVLAAARVDVELLDQLGLLDRDNDGRLLGHDNVLTLLGLDGRRGGVGLLCAKVGVLCQKELKLCHLCVGRLFLVENEAEIRVVREGEDVGPRGNAEGGDVGAHGDGIVVLVACQKHKPFVRLVVHHRQDLEQTLCQRLLALCLDLEQHSVSWHRE